MGLGPLSAHPGDVSPCLGGTAGVLSSSPTSGPDWMLPTLQAAHLTMDSSHMCCLQPSPASSSGQSPWPWLTTAMPEAVDTPHHQPHIQRLWTAPLGWGHGYTSATLGVGQSTFTTPWHLAPQKGLKPRTTTHQCLSQTCSFPMGEKFNTINILRRVAASPWNCTDCKQFCVYRNNKKLYKFTILSIIYDTIILRCQQTISKITYKNICTNSVSVWDFTGKLLPDKDKSPCDEFVTWIWTRTRGEICIQRIRQLYHFDTSPCVP